MRPFILSILFLTTTLLSAQINTERMLIIGRNALFYDDYALSIQYFNQIISAKPYLHEPYFYRGLAKFYLEDYSGSEIDCGKAIDINPYYINSYEVRGLARINQKNYIGAAHDYESALRIDDDNKNIWHNLILCYIEIDSLPQADSALERLITKWPDRADGYLLKAEVLIKGGDTLKAEQYADRALRVDTFSVQAHSMKASLLMQRDELTDAEGHLNEALRLEPKNVRNIINRALCRFHLSNYRGAMSDYDLALDIDPTNFVGHYNRGLLRASVGEDNKAIEDFDFILERDPDDIMTLFNRARLYDQTGDYQSAIRDYTKVIEEYPKFLYGYQLRAQARRKIGDTRGAMQDEEHILRENVAHQYGYATPTNSQKNRTRKKSQINPNDFQQPVSEENEKVYDDEFRGKIQNKEAEVKLLPIIVLIENENTASQSVLNDYTIEAYQLTADIMADFHQGIESCMKADETRLQQINTTPVNTTGNNPTIASGINSVQPAFAEATAAFKRCTDKAPQFAEAYYNQAYTLAMQGKFIEAITALDTAISRKPQFAMAYYNRGIIKLFSGHQQAAISDLSQAGELGIYQAYSIIKNQEKKKK